MKFILFYSKEQGQDIVRLADKETRMIQGSVSGCVACFGLDAKTAVVRMFLDDVSALAWLKDQVRKERPDAEFFIERPDEKRVELANGDLAVMGRVRRPT